MKRLRLLPLLLPAALPGPPAAPIDFTDFHTPAEVDQELTGLANAYPTVARIFTIGSSWQANAIRGLKISDNVATDEAGEGDVVFVATHHAREWISTEMALYLAEYLLTHYDDPQLKPCLDNLEVWIIPVLNPDGYQHSAATEANRFWRKNRRNNGDGTYGVDLNRNYGFQWGLDSGSSSHTTDETYRGPSPFSEPEVAAIRDFLQGLHGLKALVTYHSFGEKFLRPWSYTTADPPGEATLRYVAQDSIAKIATVHGHTYTENLGYLCSGEATDYLWGQMRVAAFTPELRPAPGANGFDPDPAEVIPSNEENLVAAVSLIKDAGCRRVWIKDHPSDTGVEPSAVWTGSGWSQPFWVSPDIWTDPPTLVEGTTVSLKVRVHNDGPDTANGTKVRAYYTDPRVALEFPALSSILIGEKTANLSPGDSIVTFPWTVPTGTNIWGERHWCVGAVVLHPEDRPLTTEIQRSSNIGARNFEILPLSLEGRTVFVALTNYLDVAAEAVVRALEVPHGWEVIVPHVPPKQKMDRKARLLRVGGPVLQPGETLVQPIRVLPRRDSEPGTTVEINVHGALLPLLPGKRVPVGNGFTFQMVVKPEKGGPASP